MVLPHFIIHYCLCLWKYQWTRLLRAAAFPMLRNCPPSNRVIKFESCSANVIYSWTDTFTSFIFLCIIPLGSSLGPLHCIINSCWDFTVQHCYYIYGITSIMMLKMWHLLSFWMNIMMLNMWHLYIYISVNSVAVNKMKIRGAPFVFKAYCF
jgi:hypothetical protein